MNKYIVAFIDFHSNILKQELVESDTELNAAFEYLKFDSGDYSDVDNIDELKELCFTMDSMISVYQI